MTLKSLFSKLMKEDLKHRLWAIALIGLGYFFLFPVAVAFMATQMKDSYDQVAAMKLFTQEVVDWLDFDNPYMIFCMIAAALVCGLSSFGYLNTKKQVDFYHSLPIRREKLFFVHFVDGILIVFVPYVVCVIAAVFVGMANGITGLAIWRTAFSACVLHMIYYCLLYATVVLAAMLTGHLLIGFFGSVVFFGFFPLVSALMVGYMRTFFQSYVVPDHGLWEYVLRFSPVAEYVKQFERYADHKSILIASCIVFVISVILMDVSCLLYRKRPSEAAGRAMAFEPSCSPIRIAITLVSALGLGWFFWGLEEHLGWALFGIVCGSVISHGVIEAIYHFELRKLFSHKWQLIVCMGCSALILLVFRFDLIGYDRYVPEMDKISEAAIRVGDYTNWVSYGGTVYEDEEYQWKRTYVDDYIKEHMQYRDVENLVVIARECVRQLEQTKQENHAQESEAVYVMEAVDGPTETVVVEQNTQDPYTSSILIQYTLKNGKKVMRNYSRVELDGIEQALDQMYQSEEFLKGAYPLMDREAEEIAAVTYREDETELRLENLSAEEKQELLKSYQTEFAALTMEQMKEEYPIGLLRFTTFADEEAMAWFAQKAVQDRNYEYQSRRFGEYDYYPLYASFTETIAQLEKQGILCGSYERQLDPQSIRLYFYQTENRKEIEIEIQDADEIAKIMDVAIISSRSYYNSFYRFEELSAELSVVEDGRVVSYHANIPKGKLPEFVKTRIE